MTAELVLRTERCEPAAQEIRWSERAGRAIVAARGMGRCEMCGRQATNFAHRLAKGQGGLWSPANGILLCGSGTTGCHGWCHANPTSAQRGGWIITTGEHPADVPVYLRPRTLYAAWWLLDDDGCYSLTDRTDVPLMPVWAKVGEHPRRVGATRP